MGACGSVGAEGNGKLALHLVVAAFVDEDHDWSGPMNVFARAASAAAASGGVPDAVAPRQLLEGRGAAAATLRATRGAA